MGLFGTERTVSTHERMPPAEGRGHSCFCPVCSPCFCCPIYASILIGISQSNTEENEMKSNPPLTSEEVINLICDEKDGLALQLHKEIAYRNASADHSSMHCCKTLASDTKVARIRKEIVNVMRRYSLQCEHCGKESILGSWHLLERETLFRCPECNRFTPRPQHKDSYALEDLFPLIPAPLQDLFAEEK